MTRRKKTRSLADKVMIRTGRRKDFKKWRSENPEATGPSKRMLGKKAKQRKEQAARKQERQRREAAVLPEATPAERHDDADSEQ